MACFSCLFSQKAASSVKQTVDIDEVVSGISNLKLYSYKELQNATENFSEDNKIGQGGFGSVYKGTLKDGSVAAIKVLSGDSRQGSREFLTEIEVIASLDHENLVKLYGCCAEGNHRILVYGYLENNSLSQTLLDFGLAKFIAPNLTHVSTRVAGTAGYIAPEYAIRGQVTRKADIYSFGVLVLEIVSGRCNTNRRLPSKEQYLLERVWELHERGHLVELVDTSLNEDLNVEEACRFMKIGLLCTQDKPKLRPSMSTVVKMLTGEIDVDDEKIDKPGMLSEFMNQRDLADVKHSSYSLSPSGKVLNSSSSSEQITTSFATMTFNSIYDRSN